jgi:tetratricopeptide (TPR) repeat protein
VAIDRAQTLRNAEKLIRQGKIDAGIAEYVRLVEDSPHDWNAKNVLGDLYARAGQVDKAIAQFIEIADNLSDEGQTAKAGALYKKILKLKPDHEHSLLQVAEMLAMQRLYADARAHLNTLIQLRTDRGDKRGALQAKVRLGSLDPEDYEGRRTAATARIEMGDVGGALGDLKEIAGELSGKERWAEAIEVLRQAAKLNPEDDEIRERLLDVYQASGDYARARECATSVEQFRMIAAALDAQGKNDEALDTLRQAALQNPFDNELKAELARTFVARGDTATAAEYLTAETAGDDPELLMTVADIQLRGETPDEGIAIVKRLLAEDASRREQMAMLGWRVAEQKAESGFAVVELVADAAVAETDWAGAAAALQEFVTRVPNHIAALMRLVEICVDGGLEATMYSAQSQLADAYIAAGMANEARFIAEDLVAREPWERANVERFRRALELMGESDPDAVIAQRLSGDSPFMSTELLMPLEPEAEEPSGPLLTEEEVEKEVDPDILVVESLERDLLGGMSLSPQAPVAAAEKKQFTASSAHAIDLNDILGDFEEPAAPPPPKPATAHAASEDVEVDLSIVMNGAKPSAPPAAQKPAAAEPSVDLDSVFGNMREQSTRKSGLDEADKEYKRGLALRAKGDIEGCIAALENASRSPKLRFATSRLIARLYRDRKMMEKSVEWLERATQSPAPTSDDGHQALYELADGLEQVGEGARALAVLLELQAEAGAYQDIDARISRLTKVQA